MNPWKEHIAQLDELTKVLKEQLLPYWKPAHKKEKLAQLKSVEKSVRQLKKSNTPIPEELRQLKFRLINDLELFKEARLAMTAINNAFQEFSSGSGTRKTRNHKLERKPKTGIEKRGEARVTIKELVDANILSPGTRLSREYKGIVYQAEITTEGAIKLNLNSGIGMFKSPSSAAAAVTHKPQSGWTWWFVDDQPIKTTLDYFRQKFKGTESTSERKS